MGRPKKIKPEPVVDPLPSPTLEGEADLLEATPEPVVKKTTMTVCIPANRRFDSEKRDGKECIRVSVNGQSVYIPIGEPTEVELSIAEVALGYAKSVIKK